MRDQGVFRPPPPARSVLLGLAMGSADAVPGIARGMARPTSAINAIPVTSLRIASVLLLQRANGRGFSTIGRRRE